jgi:hypothetical protein
VTRKKEKVRKVSNPTNNLNQIKTKNSYPTIFQFWKPNKPLLLDDAWEQQFLLAYSSWWSYDWGIICFSHWLVVPQRRVALFRTWARRQYFPFTLRKSTSLAKQVDSHSSRWSVYALQYLKTRSNILSTKEKFLVIRLRYNWSFRSDQDSLSSCIEKGRL